MTGFDDPAETNVFKRGEGTRAIDATERVFGVIRDEAEIRPKAALDNCCSETSGFGPPRVRS